MIDVNCSEVPVMSQNSDFDKGENYFKVWKLRPKSTDEYKTLIEFGL